MINGAITVLVITLRAVWPALIALSVFASLGFLALAGHRFPPLRSFLILYLPLLVLSTWGGANWAAEEHGGITHWRSTLLNVLALLSIGLIVLTPLVYRRAPRWWLLIPAALASLVLGLFAWFVATMAISNTWL